MTYNVFGETLNLAQSINLVTFCNCTLTDNSSRGEERGSPFTVILSNKVDNEARRGHNYKLYLLACKSNIRSNNFNYRVTQKWNSLPSSIDFTSLKRFHKSLAPKVTARYFLFS